MSKVIGPRFDLGVLHEERILRLERDSSGLREDVAGSRSDLRHLQNSMESLESKVDNLEQNLGGKIDDLKEIMQNHAAGFGSRLTVIENEKRILGAQLSMAKKIAFAVLGTAGGAALVKFGESIYDWFVR